MPIRLVNTDIEESSVKSTPETPEALETPVLKDMGAVSEVTCGVALLFPWLEAAIPPYNHWCPIC